MADTLKTLRPARIYGRYSSVPQEEGTSRQRQIEGARKYAAQNGFTIVGEYFDHAVSGKAGANLEKEFGRLLKEARSGETILVEFLDRIGRQNPILLCKLLYDTVQKGIQVISYLDGKEINSENIEQLGTQLSIFTGAAIGFGENTRKIERINKANQIAFETGERGIMSGELAKWVPQGYKWDDEKKEITITDRAKYIRMIYDMFCKGHGRTAICKALNNAGVKPVWKKSTSWNEKTITKILTNEAYTGIMTVRNHRMNVLPPIIKRPQWDKVQVLVERYKERAGKYTGGRINNLFAGIGVCADCGAKIHVQRNVISRKNKTAIFYYHCRNHKRGDCPNWRHIRCNDLEVSFFLSYFGGSPENQFGNEQNEHLNRIEELEARLSKLRQAISNLYDLVEAGDEEAIERVQKRKGEIIDVEKELLSTRDRILEYRNVPAATNELLQLMLSDSFFDSEEFKNLKAKVDKRLQDNKDLIEEFETTQLLEKLADSDTRFKIRNLMPQLFSKVVISLGDEVQKPQIVAYDKQGKKVPSGAAPKLTFHHKATHQVKR